MAVDRDSPHLPYPAPIDAYGKGGFRFADMSHLGSLLCTPDGIWACDVASPAAIKPDTFDLAFTGAPIDYFVIGSGRDPWPLPQWLRQRFREHRMTVETMSTAAAVSTYNILLGERRRVGALLLAVE
jgi:uncharacterized protein